jgi:hypothetical protein
MVQVMPIDLTDAGIQVGALQFLRAEWWKEAPRFVLLRYAINGRTAPYGIRMDIDKRAILDSVGDPDLDSRIRGCRLEIWDHVAKRLPPAIGADLFAAAVS